jgi:two-component system sensor histidine kinase PilS (NtrC family)
MNRGGAEILGLTPGAVIGRGVDELLGLDVDFLAEARRILLAKRRFRFEKEFRAGDGREIFLGIAVSTLHDRIGQPLGYILIFQDLTEIRDMENELRLKDRMAALGEMAAGMAHELRNPLAAMSGAVQFLKADLRPHGETLDLFNIILRESQRLEQAIRDFLTFARPGRFAPEPCDLVRLLEESLRLLAKSAELSPAHRVQTRFDDPTLWCPIDPNRMKQVFWNLATNALKAMPDGGTLSIAARRAGAEVEISFADEGTGMDARELAGYFQPFRSSFREGTGLGAAIVYRIVEEHGGRIHLESAPGRGTRVSIALPAERAAGQEARLPDVVEARGGATG